MFSAPAVYGFKLYVGSPLIGAGTWLTTTNGTGTNSTTLIVNDASYFSDGWGLSSGDVIQLQGQTTSVTITDIDYATNTITISDPLSWANGIGVAQPYANSAPTIGAYEETIRATLALICR